MPNFLRVVCYTALSIVLQMTALFAQDVTLTSRDGKIQIVGNLLGYDGQFYRVMTSFGELSVDGKELACEGSACPDVENFVAELRFSGSASMGSILMPALVEAFALKEGYITEKSEAFGGTGFQILLRHRKTEKPAARFFFRVGNTSEGFADVLVDDADVVMALREVRPNERKRAIEVGLGDMMGQNRSRVLALDAIVPVVSAGNPVTVISPRALAKVFSGQITNWADLGGVDAPISLHLPETESGLYQAIVDQVLEPEALEVAAQTTRHQRAVDLARAVASDQYAIGLTSFAAHRDTRVLPLSGVCGRFMSAKRRSIKTEDWPLTSPLFLYFPARRLPLIGREFLSFTRTPAAQLVIRRSGFVDQTPEEFSIENQGNRLANAIEAAGVEITLEELQRMTTTLKKMSRLSTSFRFEPGSVRLDAQSRSNVQQLARALEVGQYDSRAMKFVGFSDGQGAAKANRNIALRRAETVMRAVQSAAQEKRLDRVTLEVDAFGEALPMACDNSHWGREVNRRVEVWVR